MSEEKTKTEQLRERIMLSENKGVKSLSAEEIAYALFCRFAEFYPDALRERFGDNVISYGRDLRFRERTSDTQPMNKQRH